MAEAIAAVVVVSVSLTLIAQSLLTNFHAGTRFEESVAALLALENQMGLLYVTNGSDELFVAGQALEAPYEKFSLRGEKKDLSEHLKEARLALHWHNRKKEYRMEATTLLYVPPAIENE